MTPAERESIIVAEMLPISRDVPTSELAGLLRELHRWREQGTSTPWVNGLIDAFEQALQERTS